MNSIAVQRLLDRLDEVGSAVRSTSDGHMAQCPAHNDHSPSLHVSEGDEGRAVLHCHAGCEVSAVLDALDLRPADLFATDTPTSNGHPTVNAWHPVEASYPYTDELGALLFTVERRRGKRFVCRRPDGRPGINGVRRVLYRLPQVLAAITDRRPVFVVEGEKDADALTAVGQVATCNPHGAGKWRPEFSASLADADVVIVADDDAPGRAHAQGVHAAVAPVAKSVLMTLPAEGCKDVSDHLGAGYGVPELRPVLPGDLIASDEPSGAPHSGVDLLAGVRNGAWLDAEPFPPLRYAVPAILPEGSTLLVGPPKVGKSWLVLAAALAVAAGGSMLGIPVGQPRPVLYLALEDGPRRLQDRCRTLLAGEHIPELFDFLTWVQPEAIMATLAAWLKLHGDREPLVILDTLGRVLPPARQGETTYSRDYRVGAELKALADQHPGTALLVNHHDRKATAEDFVDSVSGTHGLAGSADTILVLRRQRNEHDGLLLVTGRDVPEGEFALKFSGSAWSLDGDNLAEASVAAHTRRTTANLGDMSSAIVAVVNARPEGVRAVDVAAAMGADPKRVADYLTRLERSGRVERLTRGLYVPMSKVSRVSNPEVGDDQ